MAQAYTYGLILLTFGSLYLLLLRQVWKRKNIQPLKVREPNLMLISLIGGFIVTVMICFREIDPEEFSCSAYIWISNMFLPLFLLPYLLRIIRLKFIYHWSYQKAYNESNGKWHYKHKKWFSKSVLLGIVTFCLLIQIILAYFMDLYAKYKDEEMSIDDKPGCVFEYEFYPFLMISLVYAVLLIISLISLKGVKDSFGIAKEMKQCICLWTPCVILFFLCNLWKDLYWINDWFATSTWILLMVLGSSTISYLFPLVRSHNFGDNLSGIYYSNNITNAYRTLDEILEESTGVGREQLLKYLIESFCPEYLKFLNDVDNYRSLERNKRSGVVHEIKARYLDIGGELHLDCLDNKSSLKDEIITTIQNRNVSLEYPSDLYDKAYDEVKSELKKQYFNGFLQSIYHDELLRSLNTHPDIVTGLRESNLL